MSKYLQDKKMEIVEQTTQQTAEATIAAIRDKLAEEAYAAGENNGYSSHFAVPVLFIGNVQLSCDDRVKKKSMLDTI